MAQPTQYQGLDVLEVEANRFQAVTDDFVRRFNLLDQRTGVRWADELEAAPAIVRPFVWTALGREEALAMRSFVDDRKGRAIPFWVPTWQQDLQLHTDAVLDQTILEIDWVRYTGLQFPSTAARRHLAVYSTSHVPSYHYIVDADDPGNFVTETIQISPGAARNWPKGSTIFSFLRLCRLENDVISWIWESTQVLHALIEIREIPAEVPYVV